MQSAEVVPIYSRSAGARRFMVRLSNGDWARTKNGRRLSFATEAAAKCAIEVGAVFGPRFSCTSKLKG